jgi:hypothetical protein
MTNNSALRSGAAALTVIAAVGVAATPASAKTTTLRLFAHTVSSTVYSTSGQPLKANTLPTPGSYIVLTRKVYSGSATSHAKSAEGTINMKCTLQSIVSNSNVGSSCTTTLTIGRSSLVARANVNVASLPRTFTVSISKGTGAYRGAKGHWTSTSVNLTDTNMVITVKT